MAVLRSFGMLGAFQHHQHPNLHDHHHQIANNFGPMMNNNNELDVEGARSNGAVEGSNKAKGGSKAANKASAGAKFSVEDFLNSANQQQSLAAAAFGHQTQLPVLQGWVNKPFTRST